MSQSERRAVLEAIVSARDPRVTPSDRLRALELLRELGDEDLDTETFFRHEVAKMSDDAVRAHFDAFLAAEFAASGFSSERYPETGAVLAAEVERRVRANAERTADEVDERADQRFRQFYAERAFSVVANDSTGASDEESDDGSKVDFDDDPQFEVFRRITSR